MQRQFGRYRVHPQHYFCIDRSFFELAQNAEGDIRSQIDQQNVGFARIQDLFELDSAGADTSQVKAIDTGQDGFESFGQNRFIAEEKRSCHFAHQNIIDVNYKASYFFNFLIIDVKLYLFMAIVHISATRTPRRSVIGMTGKGLCR